MTFEEIAKKENLEIVDTNKGVALIDFDNWNLVETLAEKYNLEIVSLQKNDGEYWYHIEKRHFKSSYDFEPYDYCYEKWYYKDGVDEDDILDDLKGTIDGLDDIDTIADYAVYYRKIRDRWKKMNDDEVICFDNSDKLFIYEVFNRFPVSVDCDTKHWRIALMQKEY